ncbi:MAG: hypothetical protein QXO33_04160 [Nitrososphaeria archaeon]
MTHKLLEWGYYRMPYFCAIKYYTNNLLLEENHEKILEALDKITPLILTMIENKVLKVEMVYELRGLEAQIIFKQTKLKKSKGKKIIGV